MFWPVILPLQLTCMLLAGSVILLTVIAPRFQWQRRWTCLNAALVAGLLFIPAFFGAAALVDTCCFGRLYFSTGADVGDDRIARYLSPTARTIALENSASGHRAVYILSEAGLIAFLDGLWERSGKTSTIKRGERDTTTPMADESFQRRFRYLGWGSPSEVVKYEGPRAPNGAGATYYVDRKYGRVYHDAAYW